MITPLIICGVVITGAEFSIGYYLKRKIDKYNVKLNNLYREIEQKRDENIYLGKVTQDLEIEKKKLLSDITLLKENFKLSKETYKTAFEDYCFTLEDSYNTKEQEYDEKVKILYDNALEVYDNLVKDLKIQYNNKNAELDKIKKTIAAGTEALRKAEQDKEARNFYKLKISEKDLEDVVSLLNLCSIFNNPRALRMVVWSSYFQKETSNLCARTKVDKVTGIYKITNVLTEKIYIGQSSDIASRWKTHIKYGLGIDTPTTNLLYKAMMEYGVWNFTFELLETCSQVELNECERKWIEIYQSDKFGYNGNKGVGK